MAIHVPRLKCATRRTSDARLNASQWLNAQDNMINASTANAPIQESARIRARIAIQVLSAIILHGSAMTFENVTVASHVPQDLNAIQISNAKTSGNASLTTVAPLDLNAM